ncbi:MAG: exodeoxyribonuclease VII small subunit [Clostridia bacterium]|nr:exodeoxyribonuclease VII small subunit [Clostridia bacterium]
MKKSEDINFEEAMKNLEEIANELEKNELDLDKAVEKFEEGMELSKKCNEILTNAEKRITILINNGDGNLDEEPFDANQA